MTLDITKKATVQMNKFINKLVQEDIFYAQKAYILATVYHETKGTFLPIYEDGDEKYFLKYEKGKLKAALGNCKKGDGFRYRGRGYVQITGRDCYHRVGKYLKIDLEGSPDQALDPDIAYLILTKGMTKGLFTGRKLDDYISIIDVDLYNARRVVNALDKAELIANYALEFTEMLRKKI